VGQANQRARVVVEPAEVNGHCLSGHGIDDSGRNIGVGSGRSSRTPSTTDMVAKLILARKAMEKPVEIGVAAAELVTIVAGLQPPNRDTHRASL
jgi:hypothetical protein